MIPASSTIAGEIRHLLHSLNASNSDTVFQHLIQFTSYGTEGSILLLHICFDHLSIYEKDFKSAKLEPIFTSVFKYLLDRPNFATALCESMKTAAINEEFLQTMSSALQLSASEKIGVGLALSESENNDISTCGKNFCMGQIGELCSNQLSMSSTDQIQGVLLFLHRSDTLSKHVDSFMQMLSLVQLKDKDQFILAPLLSDEQREANFLRNLGMFDDGSEDDFDAILAEIENEMSMDGIVKELGYECTGTVSQCKEILSVCLPLTEVTVARVLSTAARTHTGLEDNQNMLSTFCFALGSNNVSDVPSMTSWNVDVLIESIKQLAPGISWLHVVEKLDQEGFYIPNEASFSFFMSLYRCACQEPFPLHTVCGSVWKNAEGQLSFLRYAVSAPPEVFTFAHSIRQLAYLDAVSLQTGHANDAWLCLDLLELLCHLAERGNACAVRSILEYPLKHCPEILILGLANVNTTYNLLQNEVSLSIFPLVLKSAAGSGMIHHLWHMNPDLLLRRFVDAASVDLECISRILDACQELKAEIRAHIVQSLLAVSPSALSIRLAALAFQRELVDLEKWLNSNISASKDSFYEECLKFLKEVQLGTQDSTINHHQLSGSPLDIYLETRPIFLKVLQSHQELISSSHLHEEFQRLHTFFLNANSEPKKDSVAMSLTSDGYADDIESEANSYFHQIFSGQLTLDAIILILLRLKESSEKREQLIFECMIANLFEEYKFFSKYPEMQLIIAANLFGLLIKNQLVTHLTLGIALRAVLDALHKPADSKMFVFGIKALEQFVDRLIEWPQYCNHIMQISHLRATHAKLVTFIEKELTNISAAHSDMDMRSNGVVNQHLQTQPLLLAGKGLPHGSGSCQTSSQVSSFPVQVPQRLQIQLDDKNAVDSFYMNPALPSPVQPIVSTSSSMTNIQKSSDVLAAASMLHSSSTGVVRPAFPFTSARFGSALNIETLVAAAERRETTIKAPPPEVQDKILFIINNLSAANVEAKAKEFTEILKEEYRSWFAQYVVMKRASIEPNFHDLYLKFIDEVNSKALNKEIIQVTYENCKVLLGSDLIKSSSEERSLLKNLGSWLGKITIGRNQALLGRKIDPKFLIIEAFERGMMIAVIPFTSKVLEACQSSLAYQPPNPWTMGILELLSEIYAMPNLKMNLKFDIEVLMRNLCVDLKDVRPSSFLKDRVREVEGNPDFSTKDALSSQSQMIGEVKSGMMPPVTKVELPLEVSSPSLQGGQTRVLPQHAAPRHPSAGTLTEDGKLAAGSLSNLLPSAQNLLQGQSSFSLNELPGQSTNIEQQVMINPKLQAFGLHSHFQRVLPIAMERALKDIVTKIVNRSVTISTTTTKELVLKDYAMETNDNCARQAANLMVASLAGSLAHVTCKEQLRFAILSQLMSLLQGLNVGREKLEQAVELATNDNLYLGCALIERAATEKAIQAIDVEMTHQLAKKRKQRDSVGPTYLDGNLHTQGHTGVPEALQPKSGRLSQSQQRVYQDFIRSSWQNQSGAPTNSVPGLINTGIDAVPQALDVVFQETETGCTQLHGATANGMFAFTTNDALDKYLIISDKLEKLVASNSKESEIQGVVAEVPMIILRCIRKDEAAIAVALKVFKGLYEDVSNKAHVKTHLAMLVSIRDVSKDIVKELTSWVIYSEEEQKFNKDITVGLIRSELLNLAEYNIHMAELLDAGRNKAATNFAISLIQTLEITDFRVLSELQNLVDALPKVAAASTSAFSTNSVGKEDISPQSKDVKATSVAAASKEVCWKPVSVEVDDVGFQDKVSFLFGEWYQLCELPATNDAAYAQFVLQLQQIGLLKGDDTSDRYFYCLMEISVSHCLSSAMLGSGPSQKDQVCPLSFLAIDIYAKLILTILKFFPVDLSSSKSSFFPKVLVVTVKFIRKDAEEKKISFNPRPYFRLFVDWLSDLSSIDHVSDGANLQILIDMAIAFHDLQPLKVPGFSFAWLELVSHRSFMPKLLARNGKKGWHIFQCLLVNLFEFMEPFMRNAKLEESVHFVYKGMLRVLLVLLHDFPEFLCAYHFSFCNVIPPSCIQMRNIILSAYPRNMRLPDPSTRNLKIDLMDEISHSPHIFSEVDVVLKAKQLKNNLDEYLKIRPQGSQFLSELKHKMLLSSCEAARAGTRYNVPLMNSLVLYVGMQAIAHLNSLASGGPLAGIMYGAALDIYQTLIVELDTEGRYLFLNAMANQLRYPNSHTHYFSSTLLHLFAESNQEVIQEQISRVLLERIILSRPHPWGLQITFMELIKNRRYNFWGRAFTSCAPEIEKLFKSLSRSCGVPNPVDEADMSGGIPNALH